MNEKLFEYRIKYNAGEDHSAIDNYHYYMAENSQQAFRFHVESIKHLKTCVQNVSIEKYNPYSQKWEDRSEVINEKESNYYS
jgi:hypothetical protein